MPKTSTYDAKVPDGWGVINYTDAENDVWRDLYAKQLPNVRAHSAPEYLAGLDKVGLPTDRVPQCGEVSCQRRTKTAPDAGSIVHHLAGSGRSKSAPLCWM